jgi:hypothetical protein
MLTSQWQLKEQSSHKDDHLYVSLIVVAIPFSSLSSLITGFNKSSTACATSAAAHLTLAKLRCSIFIFSV